MLLYRMSLCVAGPQAAVWLLWLSRPARSSQSTAAVLSSARHLGTNRLHSLPRFLVLAAVLAMALEPAYSASLHTRESVCARVCEYARVWNTASFSYVFTDLCFATFFFPPLPSQFFFSCLIRNFFAN